MLTRTSVLLAVVLCTGTWACPAACEDQDGVETEVAESTGMQTKSSLQTDPDGWVDIMPPVDLQGWSRVPVPPKGKLGRAQWHLDTDREVLICDGDGGHDMLLLKQVLGDAIFHFEFRYTKIEGRKGYNSGAYVRNSPDGAIWHQAQFGDAQDGFLFGMTPTTEGKPRFFTLKKEVKDGRVKPAGEWNTMEVTAQGKTLTLWINGAVTCRFKNCGQPKGHVGLESEGYRVEFRNLKVKELPEKPKVPSDAESDRVPHAIDAFWNGFTRESIQLGQTLLIVKGSKGFVGCTYLNIDTFERFGEVCAIIPAGDFDKMLDAKVSAVTSHAKALGIEVGMSGRETLELLR